MYGKKSTNGHGKNAVDQLFKRTDVIGQGKFGIVYKGYYVKTRQVCAIKVLNLDSADDEVEDVQKEIQFLASLKSVPNITHYYGSYLNETKLWVIMEYCAGGSLRTLLRPGKIGEHYIGIIMRELLTALMHIHRDGVIHRDIKAANVLITNDGHVKLCDFGVAAQLSQTKIRRQTMAGTPYWMAPEVIMEGVYYDTKVDIWSLGITLYEIATGNPPYCEIEALRAMQLITKSKPPRLEGREYSAALKEVIALCLDEDPRERPTAEELLKTKFMKLHRNAPVSTLKELVSRYLLHRDQQPQREAATVPLDGEENGNEGVPNNEEMDLEVKWDFDSLSSNEYIVENDINIDAIADGSPNEHFNYAYPEDGPFYESNKRHLPNFQNTTIGKGTSHGLTNNHTIQGTNNNNNTTYQNNTSANYQSKQSWVNTGKKYETKASKALQQLFEDHDTTGVDLDYSRTVPTMPPKLPEDNMRVASPLAERIPYLDAHKNPMFESQSTPSLPMLQTNFSQPVLVGPQSSTALPTPIEIEIPEELPSSQEAIVASITKPRSSTISGPNKAPTSILARRPTVTGGGTTRDVSHPTMKIVPDDRQRPLAPMSTSKPKGRSSSPSKVGTGSPGKSNAMTPAATTVPLAMKPIVNEKADVLLKPLNGEENDVGRTRINRDFKRQNPNLKLQMPSPTSALPNNLLDTVSGANTSSEDANINQFGFNTSSALPVAMTPVIEKGDIMKRKVSLGASVASSSRNSSVSTEGGGATAQHPAAIHGVSNIVTTSSQNTGASASATIHGPNPVSTSTTAGTRPVAHVIPFMERPPRLLQMDMFLDYPEDPAVEESMDHDRDRKFLVLRELDSLLRTVEDSFPAMEYALKEALSKTGDTH
ncbi:LADA_0A02432g1_1 [Lachancea dasiensis]|uniref:non-specific serine/threonine protein kinase n=1 Tax=Lachancea dasiensis TaxID=1072105 RepID=A0A1G4IMK7_9SACH|nr:LADA_0A02432g1_1 [Lachancea dasiensis]